MTRTLRWFSAHGAIDPAGGGRQLRVLGDQDVVDAFLLPVLDLDAEAVGVDVDLDDLAEQCRGRLVRCPAAGRARCWAATMPACRAAPRATTSLTASELSGGLPVSSCSICRVIGMCVEPPTSSTRSTWSQVRPAWRSTCCVVSRVRISRSRVRSSNSGRVSGTVSTLPAWVQVMVVCGSLLSVRLARSAAALQVGQRLRIGARVVAVLLQELAGDVIDDAIVPVLAAQPDVALDGQASGNAGCDRRTSVTSKVPPPRS